MTPMSRCEQWLAATMKFVCCGTWLAPVTRVSSTPLVEQPLRQRQAALAGAGDRRRDVDVAVSCGRRSRRRRSAGAAAPGAGRCRRRCGRARSAPAAAPTSTTAVRSASSGSATPSFSSALASSAYIKLSKPSSPRRLARCTSPRARPDTVGDQLEQPADAALVARGDHASAPVSLSALRAQPLELGDDLPPLDRALRRARQLAVPDVHDLDPLPERQLGRDLAEVLLDARLDLRAREHRVVLVVRHDRARDLLGRAVGQADDRQVLDERRVAVEILDLVGVDVLAVGVDDHLLRAPDQVQVPLRRRCGRDRRCGTSRP